MVDYSKRLYSLDVFRGLTMAAMVLVNNPGTWSFMYPALRHAAWDGLMMADFIFPFFLFITGFSWIIARRNHPDSTKTKLAGKILLRSLILFFMGLFLTGFPFFDLRTIRIPGVLQRIALCYCIASLCFLFFRQTGRILASISLLSLYWFLMKNLSAPGFSAGDLSMAGNFASYLDRLLPGGHLWTTAHDPEGILSTIPAAVSCLLGGIFAEFFLTGKKPEFAAGAILAMGAGIAASFWFPFNKNLWSPSYTLVTAGGAAIFFSILHFFFESTKWKVAARPFEIMGKNALILFFGSGLLGRILLFVKAAPYGHTQSLKTIVYTTVFEPFFRPAQTASFLYSLVYLIFWFGVLYFMDRRKIFIKL